MKLFYAFYCENIGRKLLVKVEKIHIGVTWSLSISEADRAFKTTVMVKRVKLNAECMDPLQCTGRNW